MHCFSKTHLPTAPSPSPEKMTTTKIQFGSAPYFELLAQHPEWNKYVAVGAQVIFVVNGVAFEIIPAD